MKGFLKLAKLTLVLVYLVIVAGAVVRMTGSGMGCPDWPKCFGYYVPPTNVQTLQWQANRNFEKGQVIMWQEGLLVAREDFTTRPTFDKNNWIPYTKHDYAQFNVWHTWIEYINRLLGALAGLATLALALVSLRFWKYRKRLILFAWIIVFGMGFQAWLGATVVYSVLAPIKITVHMLMALLIVALLLYLIFDANEQQAIKVRHTYFKRFLLVALVLTLVQIVLGTQVRQMIDEQVKLIGDAGKELWISNPSLKFYVHRSFSIIVLLINLTLFYINRKHGLGYGKINWVLFFIGMEVITGIAMYYLNFPFASQPLHLILASLLFGVQFYLVLETLKAKTTQKSL